MNYFKFIQSRGLHFNLHFLRKREEIIYLYFSFHPLFVALILSFPVLPDNFRVVNLSENPGWKTGTMQQYRSCSILLCSIVGEALQLLWMQMHFDTIGLMKTLQGMWSCQLF